MVYKNIQKRREYLNRWRKANPDKVRKYIKKYRQKHKDRLLVYNRQYSKEWREKNLEYGRAYRKEHKSRITELSRERYKRNPEKYRKVSREWQKAHPEIKTPKYRIDHSISELVRQTLIGKKKGWQWETLVGYTLDDLMKHLESLFKPWMDWDNYGKWEIDHIKPKSLFHYEIPEDPEFKKCWALENLQPLEKSVNRRKSNCY